MDLKPEEILNLKLDKLITKFINAYTFYDGSHMSEIRLKAFLYIILAEFSDKLENRLNDLTKYLINNLKEIEYFTDKQIKVKINKLFDKNYISILPFIGDDWTKALNQEKETKKKYG